MIIFIVSIVVLWILLFVTIQIIGLYIKNKAIENVKIDTDKLNKLLFPKEKHLVTIYCLDCGAPQTFDFNEGYFTSCQYCYTKPIKKYSTDFAAYGQVHQEALYNDFRFSKYNPSEKQVSQIGKEEKPKKISSFWDAVRWQVYPASSFQRPITIKGIMQ